MLSHALELTSHERADLAYEILNSLETKPVERTDDEWIAEVEKRARAALEGAPGTPWPEARQQIAKYLRRR
jgi:hypothetical protein